MAGGDDLAVDLNQVDHAGVKAPVGGQQRRVARRPMPEAEVLPHRHVRGRQPGHEHLVDERLGGLVGEPFVERNHHELLHAELGDQLGLGLEAGQQLGRGLGPDHAQRMGLEGEHGIAAADDLAVPDMHTIEFAHGNAPGAGLNLG